MKKLAACALACMMTLTAAVAAPAFAEEEAAVLREPSAALTVMADGTETEVPATLYEAEHFSVYIPDENWTWEREAEEGITSDEWENVLDEEVNFEVLDCAGSDLNQAQEMLLREEDDYALTQDEDGVWFGTDDDGDALEARIFEYEGGACIVLSEYCETTADDLIDVLAAMADSFELTEAPME